MKRWALVLVVTAAVLGCADRLVDLDEEPRHAVCATITAKGYWEDGTHWVLYDERDGAAGTACMCLTEEEKFSGERDDELNDLAFAECTRLADVFSGNFDSDNCEERYLSGDWMDSIVFARGEAAWQTRGFECSGDDPEGCSVADEPGPGAVYWSALLILMTGLRRRRPRSGHRGHEYAR